VLGDSKLAATRGPFLGKLSTKKAAFAFCFENFFLAVQVACLFVAFARHSALQWGTQDPNTNPFFICGGD